MTDLAQHQPLSSSVGAYLEAIWVSAGMGTASTKEVSDRLSVSPASVTNMFARLQDMGVVSYERYRGASLTDRGRTEALRLVRRYSVINAFLLGHLRYSWEDVHEETRRLQHAVSDEFVQRLAEFLGPADPDPLEFVPAPSPKPRHRVADG